MKKTTSVSLFIATFIATGLSATSVTAASPNYKQQLRDQTASGWAYEYDEANCDFTQVDIGGSESTSHAGGPPVHSNAAWASFYYSNWCTGQETYGWGWVPGGFSGDMQAASISLVFEADSYEQGEVDGEWVANYVGTHTVAINAEFTGVGQIFHGGYNQTSHWGHSFSHYRWVGQSRDATLDLSVTVDGVSIDLPNQGANLGIANSGSLEIYQ